MNAERRKKGEPFVKEGGLTEQQKKSFIPFSTGPRACVGRNVAKMELKLIVANLVSGFEMELLDVGKEGKGGLRTWEGNLRKPSGCRVRLRRRVMEKGLGDGDGGDGGGG